MATSCNKIRIDYRMVERENTAIWWWEQPMNGVMV